MKGDGSSRNGYGKKSEQLIKRVVRKAIARFSSRGKRKSAVDIDPASVRKVIIVRQHNQFGDVLCTVPLLRALKNKFTLSQLYVVVSPQNISALAGCPYVTELINYDKLSYYRHPSLFFKFVKKLRQGYDLLLVPSNVSISLTNDIMALFIKAGTKIGPGSLETKANQTASVYDVAVPLDWTDSLAHQYHRNMKVAEPLGISSGDDTEGLEYAVDPVVFAELRGVIGRIGTFSSKRVAIHAGAGKPPNRWNTEGFAALSDLLHNELGADIYITEGPMDKEVIDRFTGLLRSPFVRVRNRAIAFVAALLKQMDLVVTNDTGIMHLAAAVGTPTLSLFGPTDPLQWAPIGSRHKFILGRGGDINTIGVEKVFEMAKRALQIK